ncbi:MAG TPA: DUF2004 domain-containing protein [Mucilaginibacter sp.]|nr:DUF2004 domain-containing protein [Mucilaginibacter sp.]
MKRGACDAPLQLEKRRDTSHVSPDIQFLKYLSIIFDKFNPNQTLNKMIIKLPFFNELDSESLTDYYEVDIDIEQDKVQLDINFDETNIDPAKLDTLKKYLDEPQAIINIAKKEIFNDFENGEDVKEFLTYHIEELDQSELDNLLNHADKTLSLEQQILSILKLRRIGFYPDDDDIFAVLDFVLSEDISQYILVVKMNDSKTVDHITMES